MIVGETLHWTVLDTGLQIKHKYSSFQRTVNLGLYIQHGSQHEDEQTNGIAHFIEHVFFMPDHMRSDAKALLDRLIDLGASYEAYTAKEYTRCLITVLPKLVPDALEFLSLIVSEPNVSVSAVEHEKTVVLHEHGMFFSSSSMLRQTLEHTIWGDQSLGLYIMGRKNNISNFSAEQVQERIEKWYTPDRSFLVALGPIEINELIDLTMKYFCDWQDSHHIMFNPSLIVEPRLTPLPMKTERAELLIGYVSPSYSSQSRIPTELLSDILGGSIKSRLFQKLRTENQLVYHVNAYTKAYSLGGYVAIHVNCLRKDIETVYQLIQEELESLKTDEVDLQELERVRSTRSTAILNILQDGIQHLQALGTRTVYHDNFFVDYEVNALKHISSLDILSVAEKIFVLNNIAIVGKGLTEDELLRLLDH